MELMFPLMLMAINLNLDLQLSPSQKIIAYPMPITSLNKLRRSLLLVQEFQKLANQTKAARMTRNGQMLKL
jgi:hypothetical protein